MHHMLGKNIPGSVPHSPMPTQLSPGVHSGIRRLQCKEPVPAHQLSCLPPHHHPSSSCTAAAARPFLATVADRTRTSSHALSKHNVCRHVYGLHGRYDLYTACVSIIRVVPKRFLFVIRSRCGRRCSCRCGRRCSCRSRRRGSCRCSCRSRCRGSRRRGRRRRCGGRGRRRGSRWCARRCSLAKLADVRHSGRHALGHCLEGHRQIQEEANVAERAYDSQTGQNPGPQLTVTVHHAV